ncbi:MAG: succinyl-diaminopimelate desuccinylase [Beijerinckiaceae bacterium]|nr:succinyl-diaminopimelate desuccinylase [Beijerinckiaceae bacterium]
MTASALDLCRALVRCPSVTPEDHGALGVVEAELKQAVFATHRLTISEPGTPDVGNLYARIGTTAPCLAFAGHTDVVPAGDASRWRFDPFAAEVAEGAIWGRGTADMKGGIAAFVAAACAYAARGMAKGSIGFLITGDEEGPAINGTEKLLRWAYDKGERFDHCTVGEPTSAEVLGDTIKIGRRGSLNGTLTVEGRQGHAAYPERADNPIPKLLRLLDALSAPPLDEGTAHFGASNLEIVSVDTGNSAFNVIPAEARGRVNVRFNDLWTPETLQSELRQRLERSVMAGPDPAIHHGGARDARVNPRIRSGGGHYGGAMDSGNWRYSLKWEPCNASAFLTKPDKFTELVADAIEKKTGRRPALSTSGGTSDARFIRAFCPVIEFGLSGATVHMADEHIAIADLEGLTDIYAAILEDYFRKE